MDMGSLVAKLLGRPFVTEAGPVMQRGPASPAMKMLEHKGPQLPAVRNQGTDVNTRMAGDPPVPGDLMEMPPTGIPPAMMGQMAGMPGGAMPPGAASQAMSPLMRRILIAAGIGLPTAVGIGMLDNEAGGPTAMTDATGERPMVGDVTPGAFNQRFGTGKQGGLQQKIAQRKALPKKGGANVSELANKAFPPGFGADDVAKKKAKMGDGLDRPEYSMNIGNR